MKPEPITATEKILEDPDYFLKEEEKEETKEEAKKEATGSRSAASYINELEKNT